MEKSSNLFKLKFVLLLNLHKTCKCQPKLKISLLNKEYRHSKQVDNYKFLDGERIQ